MGSHNNKIGLPMAFDVNILGEFFIWAENEYDDANSVWHPCK